MTDVIDDDIRPALELSMEEVVAKRRMAALKHVHHIIVGLPSQDQTDLAAAHLRAFLTEEERAQLVLVLVGSMTPDAAEMVVRDAFKGSGYPQPLLMDNALSDARFWASTANANEIRSYAMACVERMTGAMRKNFVKWCERKADD